MKLKEEKGYTMVAVIITVVILAIMLTAVATLAMADIRKTRFWQDKTAAFYLAESGINHALYKILEEASVFEDRVFPADPPNVISEGAYDFGPGNKFEVWVKQEGSELKLTSRGTKNKVPKVVEQKLVLPYVFPPPNSVMETNPDPITNEYENFYVLNYVAPVIELPAPDESYTDGPDLSQKVQNNQILAAGKYLYPKDESVSKHGRDAILTIGASASDVTYIYVNGSLTFGQHLQVITRGQVIFYITGQLTFANNSSLTNYGQVDFYTGEGAVFANQTVIGNPDIQDTVVVWLTSSMTPPVEEHLDEKYEVIIGNQSTFTGGICAPSGRVDISQSNSVTGAVVGWEIHFKVHGEVTYDNRMATVTSGTWGLTGWSE